MKFQKLFLALLITSIYTAGITQSYRCGTDQSDAFMEVLRENKKSFEATRNKSRVDRFIPVQFHSLANTQGQGRANDKDILKALCLMNERYDETEMRFYSVGINHIDNTNIYQDPGGTLARTAINNEKNPDALNVFIVDFAGTGVGGYYTRGLDIVVILKTTLSDDRFTLEHELGHFFSLAHTHRGWDQIADGVNPQGGYDPSIHGDTIRFTTVSSTQSGNTLIELVDQSNCTEAADEICDTPPDYGFGFTCNCCTMIYDVWDSNFDKIEPMIDNVMSYSNNCEPYRFSEGQVTAMLTDFDSARRNYLRANNDVDQYTPIENEAVLVAPLDPVVEQYDGVLFDWEDVPNAERYVLRIDGDLTGDFEVTESELYVTDLMPNGTYFWFVTPINKFGATCEAEEVRFFTTGTGTTSLRELESITDYSISPNPTAKGNDTNIFLTSEIQMNAVVTVIDINGRRTLSQNENLQSGTNKIVVETSSLTSGIYILQVETDKGKITDKLLIK